VLEELEHLRRAVLAYLFYRDALLLLHVVLLILLFCFKLQLLQLVGIRLCHVDLLILRLGDVPGHLAAVEKVDDDVAQGLQIVLS